MMMHPRVLFNRFLVWITPYVIESFKLKTSGPNPSKRIYSADKQKQELQAYIPTAMNLTPPIELREIMDTNV